MPTRPEQLNARRIELDRSPELRALAERLRHLLSPLLEGEIYFPVEKPLLSRDGGVCSNDGARLSFDPLSPDVHTCPRCHSRFQSERHHRAWAWRYHLWLSERAIHFALLGALFEDHVLIARARAILDLYATRYRDFPNADNVLGPTRLFFSTYLESIWLTQIAIASILVRTREATFGSKCRELNDMVRESADIISSFDEGWSNRQVWNNTAMIAAGIWLSDDHLLGLGLRGPHGILAQLKAAVTNDGLWFEGENYHFFALRGFLLAAELLRAVDVDLYRGALRNMYAAPLATLLPDLTLPARGDAPYGVSVRQPRFAELWELGWARTDDDKLASVLTDLYESNAPVGEDPGLAEIAEQETNRPPQALTRESLGWKALLWMNAQPPRRSNTRWQLGSALLQSSGVAVLRDARYVSIECGGRPGGHGHPDLLHITLFWKEAILADFGAASYVSPSLHWYRSTLSHNAPGVSGVGQLGKDAWCEAFDEANGWSWCRACARDLLGAGTAVTRTIIVGSSYVLDLIDVDAPQSVIVDLPVHLIGRSTQLFEQLRTNSKGSLRLLHDDLALVLAPRSGEELLLADELGPPTNQFADGEPVTFLTRRAAGTGRWIQCYGLGRDLPMTVSQTNDDIAISFADGTRDRILLAGGTCRIIDRRGDAHELDGAQPPRSVAQAQPAPQSPPRIRCPLVDGVPDPVGWEKLVPTEAVHELGTDHYRRSELAYGARGPFSARVAVCAAGHHLCFAITVAKNDLHFRSRDMPDPELDNETADIHSDGVQCYLDDGEWCGYLVIPENNSQAVRVNAVRGTAGDASSVRGTWQRTDSGYRVVIAVDLGREVRKGDRIPVALVVNEMYPERTRRAGQLALVGRGGWVYLRGDREDPRSVLLAEVA